MSVVLARVSSILVLLLYRSYPCFNLFQHSTLYPLCRCGQGRDYLRDELVKAACAATFAQHFWESKRQWSLETNEGFPQNCFNACCLPLLAVVIAFKTFMCFSLACYTQFARLGVPGPIYLHTHSIIFFFLAGYLFCLGLNCQTGDEAGWQSHGVCSSSQGAVQYSDCTAFGNRESPFEFPDEWICGQIHFCLQLFESSISSHPSFLAVPDVWAAVRDILSGWLHTAFSPMHYPTCFPLPTNWSGLSYQSKGFVSVEHCWIVSLLVILEMSNAAATHTWRKEASQIVAILQLSWGMLR